MAVTTTVIQYNTVVNHGLYSSWFKYDSICEELKACWKSVYMKSSKNEFLFVRLLKNIYMKSSKRRRPASWCTGGHGARQERPQFCFHSQPSVPPCLPPSSLSLPSSSQPSDSSCLSPSSPPQQTSSVSCCLSSSSPITTFFCFFLLISYFTTSSLSLPRSFLPGQPPTLLFTTTSD